MNDFVKMFDSSYTRLIIGYNDNIAASEYKLKKDNLVRKQRFLNKRKDPIYAKNNTIEKG